MIGTEMTATIDGVVRTMKIKRVRWVLRSPVSDPSAIKRVPVIEFDQGLTMDFDEFHRAVANGKME